MLRVSKALLPLGVLGLVACGGMSPVQPKDMTAGMAMGVKCDAKALADEAMTFVVDWKDGQRSALESAMGKGVAVVKYSCDGVKVLQACRVSGDYGYAGGTQRKKVINMKDAVQAQAQFGGRHIGASFKGQFSQGRSLSLAYTTVGASSTTVTQVDKSMLTGRCKGATHFVYEAEVGAFAVATNSKGQASAFGEVFGQGSASGSTASDKSAMTADGDINACARASKRDTNATSNCEAIVRISLLPVEVSGGGGKRVGVVDLRSCPAGYVFADQECVPQGQANMYLCSKTNYAECFEQCEKGHMGSCGRLGLLNIRGEEDSRSVASAKYDNPHFEKNSHRVRENLAKACLDMGEANACMGAKNAAFYADFQKYEAKDIEPPASVENARKQLAFELYEAGCRGGEGFACTELAQELNRGAKGRISARKGLSIITQACSRSPVACGLLGMLHSHVYGTTRWTTIDNLVPTDAAGAAKAFDRACDGGLADGCYGLGFMHMPEAEVRTQMTRLEQEEKSTSGELNGALRYSGLNAQLHDIAKAKAYLQRACKMGENAFINTDHEIACGIR